MSFEILNRVRLGVISRNWFWLGFRTRRKLLAATGN